MSKLRDTVIMISVILVISVFACYLVAHDAHASTADRTGDTTFKVSPRDVTNSRVLEQRTAERMGAIALGAVVQVQDAMSKMAESASEPAYDPEWHSYQSYADYGDSGDSSGWRYTEYYPSENTGAFAYAPDLDIVLGDDGAYRDKDGYVVVASSSLGKFDTVETPYGQGKVYDTGCAAGVVDIYTNNG